MEWSAKEPQLDTLESADFLPLVNDQFLAHYGADAPLTLKLLSVREFQPMPVSKRVGFSLTFRGPAGGYLIQNIYEIEHPKLGKLSLFMVPLGPDAEGMLYEIILN
jgi:hypothetical protein